uniref:Glycosyltransferase n=1 Tax=candidate division CPR3 bacterium TaxID=2268181 RepID=A0A7C5UV39_UNCC3
MSKNPTVTIGIPFLNPGNLILEAIQSVFAQTFADWELILVDDGSNDESLEIVQKIRDSRVTV